MFLVVRKKTLLCWYRGFTDRRETQERTSHWGYPGNWRWNTKSLHHGKMHMIITKRLFWIIKRNMYCVSHCYTN